jgi:RNA polymerase sigma-70 factor (ECF subfamily)
MSEESQDNSSKNKEFFELYGQCQIRILSFLFVMVHNETDAEDLLQDTATVMLEKFETFQKGTNFTAWGIMIAKNKALNFLRKNSKSRPYLNDELYTRITELEMQDKEDMTDRSIALDKCFRELEKPDQEILKMRYYQEHSMKKIAELLGRSKTGIYHTLARIHDLLYRCIKNTMATGQV